MIVSIVFEQASYFTLIYEQISYFDKQRIHQKSLIDDMVFTVLRIFPKGNGNEN